MQSVRAGIHICGYIDPIMEDIVSLQADWIDVDAPSSLKKLIEVSQKKVLIKGNIAPDLFITGTMEEIEEAVRNCIEIAAKGSKYVVSSGCEIPFNAPLEKIGHFVQALGKYASYGETASS